VTGESSVSCALTDFTDTGFDPVAAGWNLIPEPTTGLLLGVAVRRGFERGGIDMTASTLRRIVSGFARGIKAADSTRPRAKKYQPGISPHTEVQTVALAIGSAYQESVQFEVPSGPILPIHASFDSAEFRHTTG